MVVQAVSADFLLLSGLMHCPVWILLKSEESLPVDDGESPSDKGRIRVENIFVETFLWKAIKQEWNKGHAKNTFVGFCWLSN